MTQREFQIFATRAVIIIRKHAPIKTGNLRYNAVRFVWLGANEFMIYVDGSPPDEGIAPYTVFTNEPWTSPRWRGKQNPNEGWWQRAVDEILDLLETMGGKKND